MVKTVARGIRLGTRFALKRLGAAGRRVAGILQRLRFVRRRAQTRVTRGDIGALGSADTTAGGGLAPGILTETTAAEGGAARHGDFHGPWRPLPDPDISWGKYLRQKTGTEPPAGMHRPHAHHGVFKEGLPGRQRELVEEAQDLARRRGGIDPIWGLENLGWAPNRGHTTAVMEDISNRLRALDGANGTPEDFERLLRTFLAEAAAR